MSRSKLLRPRQGLTLTEVVVLMVFIAVVAYLAYVTLPLYQDGHQQAKYIEASTSKNPLPAQKVVKSE